MDSSIATIIGLMVLCVWPLAWFGFGIYYAKYGMPFSMKWRGFGRALDDDLD